MPEAVFALTNPEPRAKSLRIKPAPWLLTVERETREHRIRRANRISARGVERSDEALFLRDEIRQASNDEIGFGPLAKFRALPGSTPEVKKILRRWDTQKKQTSRGRHRLLRDEHEPTNSFRDRVFEEADRRGDSKWHRDRSKGQIERFMRVRACGAEERGVLVCVHCKTVTQDKHGNPLVLKKMCGATLLCWDCRQIRIKKNRKRFLHSRLEALQRVRYRRLGPGQVPHDPMVERFLTLTCPHIALEQFITIEDEDGEFRKLYGPEAQAWLVRNAWRRFMNSLRNRWRGKYWKHPGFDLISFVRVLEATTGRDEAGHVHIHCWLLSPFARVQVIRALWGRALIKSGFPLELWPEHAWKDKADLRIELQKANDETALRWLKNCSKKIPYPRVDYKRVTSRGKGAEVDGIDLAMELVKYLTKDFEDPECKVLMHPSLFSAVYRGLDRGRLITASRKFWVKQHCECQACGAIDSLRPHERPKESPGLARGPPGLPLFDIPSNTCA